MTGGFFNEASAFSFSFGDFWHAFLVFVASYFGTKASNGNGNGNGAKP